MPGKYNEVWFKPIFQALSFVLWAYESLPLEPYEMKVAQNFSRTPNAYLGLGWGLAIRLLRGILRIDVCS